MKSSIQLSPSKHLDNISKMFRKLYNDEQLTDCTLYCKDGHIKAHKLILATSSPYFHRIFTENYSDNANIPNQNHHHTVLIMHGISYQNLHNLIELIYKGHVDVVAESVNPLYELAGEFQLSGITGILRSTDTDTNANNDNKNIAIDSNDDKVLKQSNGDNTKKSAWAKKQRKFKCDLCPSSFKRSSHLTRHQLVHTGERPYACNQCDKAFSRHDKLKHHVRKTHLDNEPTTDQQLYRDDDGINDNDCDNSQTLVNLQKRPRGRPRKYPISLLERQQLMKRGRGRPRINNPEQSQQFGENYDITNLPYGDLDYLTMPLGSNIDNNVIDNSGILQQNDHDSVMIEPYIEIKTECDSREIIDTDDR